MTRSHYSLLLAMCCLLLGTVAGTAQSYSRIPTESTPQILRLDNTAMIPAPYYARWMGASFNVRRDRVTLVGLGRTMVGTINSSLVTVNGTSLSLLAPILSVAGVVYLPMESVTTAFGLTARTRMRDNLVELVSPYNRQTITLPIRGQILSVAGTLTGANQPMVTAYGAYLFFGNQYNRWGRGRSISNPNLPLVWLTQGSRTIWSRATGGYELVQLGMNDMANDGRLSLWYTPRIIGADYVQQNFYVYRRDRSRMRSLVRTSPGYIPFRITGGGMVAWISQRPSRLIAFNPIFGRIHAQGPVALEVRTYSWNGRQFVLTNTRRSTGRYDNDPFTTLRTQFNIPLTERSIQAIRSGQVAVQ